MSQIREELREQCSDLGFKEKKYVGLSTYVSDQARSYTIHFSHPRSSSARIVKTLVVMCFENVFVPLPVQPIDAALEESRRLPPNDDQVLRDSTIVPSSFEYIKMSPLSRIGAKEPCDDYQVPGISIEVFGNVIEGNIMRGIRRNVPMYPGFYVPSYDIYAQSAEMYGLAPLEELRRWELQNDPDHPPNRVTIRYTNTLLYIALRSEATGWEELLEWYTPGIWYKLTFITLDGQASLEVEEATPAEISPWIT